MLTYAFDLLHAIYEEQGYDSTQTPRLILQKNLYGIEIDTRAGDLAAFALVMKARAKDRRFFSREVEPNICVLQNLSFTNREIEEYMGVVGRDLFTQDLQVTLGQFEQADNFGSLIRPQLKDVSFIRGRLEKRKVFENLFLHSTNHKVQQVLMQVEYLAPRYHVAVTNPPYMGAAGMNEELKRFALENYPESKADAYSMFIERNLELVVYEGMVGMITIPNWMFLSYFDDIRKRLIRDHVIVSLVHNGRGVFGSDFGSCSFVISKQANKDYLGTFKRLFVKQGEVNSNDVLIQRFFDIQDFPNFNASSSSFTKIPGSPIAYWVTRTDLFSGPKIGDFFLPGGRNKTHDNAMYLRYFWEISSRNDKWKLYSNGGDFRKYFGNDIYVINWSQEARDFYESQGGLLNSKYWYKLGITWNLVTISKPSFRIKLEKNFYSSGSPTIFTQDYSCDYKALGFLNSPISIYYLQAINPTVNTTIGNVFSLPYNGDAINSVVITNVERCIEIAKSDWDSFEISIDFSTHPILSNKYPTPLVSESYEAVRSNWEILIRETERLEYENNQIYTESYGLQNVLFSGVPLEEITLTCNPHYRYGSKKNESKLEALLLTDTMKDFISYSIGCMFGRYSLNKPGLILANQGETTQDYYKHIPQPSFPPDEDNVIPILEAGWFNDDITERFKKFLRVTFGDEYYEENLAFIENAIGRDIRSYFLKDFYGEHVKMYKNRPIYWLFSSPNGSFNALIYMHRYRPDTVSVVLNDYLREYVRKLNSHKAHLEQVSLRTGGSQAENAKATREINALNKILAELKDYEDEVLYPLATRQIQIDLDDGVKVNYAKFGKAVRTVKGL
jgi:type II restriction/modification system DNA methylase subunit YeeA